jgi:two-component system response regulator GlrR
LLISFTSLFSDDGAQSRICALLAQFDGCQVRIATEVPPLDAGVAPDAVVIAAPTGDLLACCRLVQTWHAGWPCVPILVFMDRLDGNAPGQLTMAGAFDIASLAVHDEELVVRVKRAIGLLPACKFGAAQLIPPQIEFSGQLGRNRLIGRSPQFAKLLSRLQMTSRCDAGVLILGETGTGKEVCAQAIHYSSARSNGPWVAINCAAIPSELVEDELFGHVRGAYTHAGNARPGLVQEAEGGTLLLDEIDSLPLGSQAKLLRFLQEKEFRPVGSSRLQRADVRVIAASNRDLAQSVQKGNFRQDLYFRLNVLTLFVPPLRDRRDDIAALAMAFFDEYRRESGQHLTNISPAALQKLCSHDWPGNVRELKNTLQRAVLIAQGPSLQSCDIELGGGSVQELAQADDVNSFRDAKARVVEAFERGYLEQLLLQCDGNISKAARAAKKNRRAFFELLRRYDINAAQYRTELR